MTQRDLDALMKGLAKVLREELGLRDARIALLENQVAELKQRPELKYLGTWQRGTTYAPGNALTHKGAIWVCKGHVATEPSVDHVFWQLACKAGRDGRDAR